MICYQSDICTDRFIVSVDGHAGYAPAGEDIICAAASALALTLIEASHRFDEDGALSHFSYSIDKGSVQLDMTVKDWAMERVEAVVDAVTGGFLMLEEHYPEYITVN